MKLDHIMYTVSDLEAGIDEIERLTGVRAVEGGAHPGNGTRNALLSLGGDQYLEILGPDPDQELAGTQGEAIQQENFSGIKTWAAATDDFDHVIEVAARSGFSHRVVDMSRTRPDDVTLSWKLLFINNHPFGGFMPFFIDWLDSPHPSRDSPGGIQMAPFAVELMDHTQLFQATMDALKLEVDVLEGPDGMRAVLESPRGKVMLH